VAPDRKASEINALARGRTLLHILRAESRIARHYAVWAAHAFVGVRAGYWAGAHLGTICLLRAAVSAASIRAARYPRRNILDAYICWTWRSRAIAAKVAGGRA